MNGKRARASKSKEGFSMKLNAIGFGNGFAATGAVLYIFCRIVAVVAPDALVYVANSWFHGLVVNPVIPEDSGLLSPVSFVAGLVTFWATAWFTGWMTATVYNRGVKSG